MATFRLERVIPLIERLIGELISRDGAAARDALVHAIMNDVVGKALVDRAKLRSTNNWSERQIAGNMVDWFSANYAVRGQRRRQRVRSLTGLKLMGSGRISARGSRYRFLRRPARARRRNRRWCPRDLQRKLLPQHLPFHEHSSRTLTILRCTRSG